MSKFSALVAYNKTTGLIDIGALSLSPTATDFDEFERALGEAKRQLTEHVETAIIEARLNPATYGLALNDLVQIGDSKKLWRLLETNVDGTSQRHDPVIAVLLAALTFGGRRMLRSVPISSVKPISDEARAQFEATV